MLDVGGIRSGPIPFRFEAMWLKVKGFKDLLKNWLQSLQFRGSPSYVLAAKLKALKVILKTWNQDVFGRVEANKARDLGQVSLWDEIE